MYVGFFGATWSPSGRRLLFLSVDSNAVVRPWLWTVGSNAPTLLGGLQLFEGLADPAVAMWSDADHAVFLVKEPSQPNEGPLYFRILRGRNVAEAWRDRKS